MLIAGARPMRHRHVLASLLALASPACTTTRTVPWTSLEALHHGAHDREGVLVTEGGSSVRIGPTTRIRFRRRDGSLTPWAEAGDLYVNDEGAFTRRKLPLSRATNVRIASLGTTERMVLWKHAPPGAKIEALETGELSLVVSTGDALVKWLDAFVIEVAHRHELENSELLFGPPDPSHPHARAIDRLRWTLKGAPLGTFRVVVPPQDSPVTLDGAALIDALREGVEINDGIRWRDVMSAELENLDGGKTLAGVAITTALVVALLPAAIVVRGGGGAPKITVNAPKHLGPSELPVREPSSPSEGDTFATDAMNPPDDVDATRLFTGSSRRRGYLRVVGALDVGLDALHAASMLSGASASLRLLDLVELGGGLRYAAGKQTDVIGIFRGGLHCTLDARGRFAIPLAFELGKGGDVRFHFAFDLGLRIAATDRIAFGLYAFRPVYSRLPEGGRWSYVSSVETVFAF